MKTINLTPLIQVEKIYNFFGIHKVKVIPGFEDVNIKNWKIEPNCWQFYFTGKNLVFVVEINQKEIRFKEVKSNYSHTIVFLTILTSTIKFAQHNDISVILMTGSTSIHQCGTLWLGPMAGFLPDPEKALVVYEFMWENGYFNQTISKFFKSDEGLNCWRVLGFELPLEFYTDEYSENMENLYHQLELLKLTHLLP